MFDTRNELREFIASDRAEAVSRACGFFGVSEEELAISSPAPNEVMNLANRCVIVAGLKSRSSSPRPPQRDRGPEGGMRRDAGDRPERGGRRDRGERGGRPERAERNDRGERPANEARSASPAPRRELEGESAEPSVGKATGTLGPIGEFVLGLVERIDAGPFEVAESGENATIAIRLSGAAAQVIAAGDARTIDAIQLLANQVSMRDGDDAKRVVVEAEGDLARREEYLARLAERAARRATETGRSVAIDPMSPRDRRIVHVALRDTDGIATMSVGSGEYRQVVVVPERAPEYAEAQRQAAASSSRRDE